MPAKLGNFTSALLGEIQIGIYIVLAMWRADYNGSRRHSQLGWQTPSAFASTFHLRRDLALRSATAPAPAAHPPNKPMQPPERTHAWIKPGGKVNPSAPCGKQTSFVAVPC